jgi:hypothetical protein
MKKMIAVLTVVLFTGLGFNASAQFTRIKVGFITEGAAKAAESFPVTMDKNLDDVVDLEGCCVETKYVKICIQTGTGPKSKPVFAAVNSNDLGYIAKIAHDNGQFDVYCDFSNNDQKPLAADVDPHSIRKGTRISQIAGEKLFCVVVTYLN